MQPDLNNDAARKRLARQVLDACEKRGFRVWQQFGSTYVGYCVQGRPVPVPKYWERLVRALSYEIACLLDHDCGWGCTVERAPGGNCLIYRPQRWHPRLAEHPTPVYQRMSQ
jgi:hypothetical protein